MDYRRNELHDAAAKQTSSKCVWCLWHRDLYREARVMAYYDSDPLYTQAAVIAVKEGEGH